MIYLDNNATTMPLPAVVDAMAASLRNDYANPSSVHQFGQSVRHSIECAREQVASLIGAKPREIVFTSGGTESINLAIRGALALRPDRRRIVTTSVEHSAVLRVVEQLEGEGYSVERVGVDSQGRLDEPHWSEALTEDTALATIIHANNETGVVFDVARFASVAETCGAIVHIDAVQSAGKVSIDVSSMAAAFVSLSAHKFHGPKGVGALYVRRRTRLAPLIVGGSQESLRRGGTEHVAGILGMGVAAESMRSEDPYAEVGRLRDSFEEAVLGAVSFAHVNGCDAPRICNTSNIGFEGISAEAILILLSEAGICASAGAACSSGSLEPSHVLKAMGIDERVAHGAIRFSLSRFTTRSELDQVVKLLPKLLARLTVLSSSARS